MDTLEVYNWASVVSGRFRHRLLDERVNAVCDVSAYLKECSDERLEKLGKALADALSKPGVKSIRADEGIKKLTDTLKEHHAKEKSIAVLIGSEVVRLDESQNSPVLVEFLGVLWILYKRCFDEDDPGSPASKKKEKDGICAGLFPSIGPDKAFNFKTAADHFGVFVVHPQKDFSRNLLKISCEHGSGRKENSDLADLLDSWMEMRFSKEYDAIRPGVGEKPPPMKLFQSLVSEQLKYRQNSFLARTGAEVPLILLIAKPHKTAPLNVFGFERPDQLQRLCVSYVKYKKGDASAFDDITKPDNDMLLNLSNRLLRFAHDFGEADQVRGADQRQGNDDFLPYFKDIELEDAEPSTRAEVIGNLIEFFLPLVFFGNRIVITGQHNPSAIPFCLSFNFSVDPGKDAKQKDLMRWASICSVGMRVILSETATALNDCAIRSRATHESKINTLIDTSHDYTKDIRSIGITLDHQGERLERLIGLADKSFGAREPGRTKGSHREFKRLAKEIEDYQWDANRFGRFLQMHLHAEYVRQRAFCEDPAECGEWARHGTRECMEALMKELVWIPHGSIANAPLRRPGRVDTKESNYASWARIFAFEEESSEDPDKDRLIGKALAMLGCSQRMSSDDLFKTEHLPGLKLTGAGKETVYRETLAEVPEQPPGLLPVLVWSLRAAVHHSFVANLLKVLDSGPGQFRFESPNPISIGAGWSDKRKTRFEWEISFEVPGRLCDEPEALPLGYWTRIFTIYQRRTVWDWAAEREKGKPTGTIRFGFQKSQ